MPCEDGVLHSPDLRVRGLGCAADSGHPACVSEEIVLTDHIAVQEQPPKAATAAGVQCHELRRTHSRRPMSRVAWLAGGWFAPGKIVLEFVVEHKRCTLAARTLTVRTCTCTCAVLTALSVLRACQVVCRRVHRVRRRGHHRRRPRRCPRRRLQRCRCAAPPPPAPCRLTGAATPLNPFPTTEIYMHGRRSRPCPRRP